VSRIYAGEPNFKHVSALRALRQYWGQPSPLTRAAVPSPTLRKPDERNLFGGYELRLPPRLTQTVKTLLAVR
jgi:hypothetical protein